MKKVRLDELKAFSVKALVKVGVSEENAEIIADVLMTTDTFGVLTHGTQNLGQYIDKMKTIEMECDKKLQELLIKKFIVEEKIEKLEQPYKTVLYLRFIRGIKIRDMQIGYTERQCFRFQNDGICFYANL